MKDRMFYGVLEAVFWKGWEDLAICFDPRPPSSVLRFPQHILLLLQLSNSLSPPFLFLLEPAFRNLSFLSLQNRRACGLGSSFSNQLICRPRHSSSPVPREVGNQLNPSSLLSPSQTRPLGAKSSLRTVQVSVSQSLSFSSPRLKPTTWL